VKKILFISGSLGLGHVKRDLAIAKELRKQNPNMQISWLAANPAILVLQDEGERLLPEADNYANDNISAENAAKGSHLNLLKYLSNARGAWATNVKIFEQVSSGEKFDVIIGDETYELVVAQIRKPTLNKVPFVMIYDFLGVDSMSRSPLHILMAYLWNRVWSQDYKLFSTGKNMALFVGELEDIPDRRFGVFLPNRRHHSETYYKFIGYILSFDPTEYLDKKRIRSKLGYGEEPLVICSVGGTSVGKRLLELCGEAYPIIKSKVPNLRMILNCGPRISPESLNIPEGVETRQYIPDLYQHFAASDLAIVLGGGTSTLELTALRRPFLYFPLEGHFEQEITVAKRLARHRAGEKMLFSQATPQFLAEKIISNIEKKVNYPTINTNGAHQAAKLITRLL
jgi:spore coat polysaccharide biosynthesis predicted glycosyltransferase SpsG